jgi:pimeloyl-ACP methyl ester carboxylesterase
MRYKSAKIDGLDVFYRESGPADAPVILLLHGFPTSSNMFRQLIPRLAGSFHVIAPDYPGFGQSSMPDHDRLNNIDLAIRARYEIRRELAPYIGLSYERQTFGTADLTRDAGDNPSQLRFVLGMRAWH